MIHAVLICPSCPINGLLLRLIDYHILVVNNTGTPRLTKFYTPSRAPDATTTIPNKIYKLISTRPAGACNFLDVPGLELGFPAEDSGPVRVVYRSYATLNFVLVVDGAESELGILDLIQVRG